MSDLNPEIGWASLFIRTGREFGMEAVAPIRKELLRLSAEMFSGKELVVYHAIVELIGQGKPPGPGELLAAEPELTTEDLSRYFKSEKTFSSLTGATDAVVQKHDSRRVLEKLSAAQAAAKSGDLTLARILMAEGSSEAPSRALQEHSGFKGLVFDFESEKRLSVGMGRLDKLLGGGVGAGGRASMSLWVASTGIGKSTFMQAVPVRRWLKEGHWVYYFTGEASGKDVLYEIARLHGNVKYGEIEYARRNKTPRVAETMQKAIDDLAGLQGRFIPHDEEFSDITIRLLAAARKQELEEAKREGKAPEHAELIVVVDNLDNAIEGLDSRAREDQIYNQAARRFVLEARRHEYHLALLHQANADGERRNGAPLKGDVAYAKALVNHAGIMVTLYRPTTTEDFESTETKNNEIVAGRRARTWIRVAKARGGKVDEIEVATDPLTGMWYDPLGEPSF